MTIREGNLDRRVARNHSQAVIGQAKFRDYFRPQHARNVRSGRNAAPRRNFFRHTAAADNVSPFEYERRKSSARQVSGGRQTVVPGADDDGVVRGLT